MSKTSNTPAYKGSEFIRIAAGSAKDILTILLEPDEMYTEDQVDQMADDYLKKEVKS